MDLVHFLKSAKLMCGNGLGGDLESTLCFTLLQVDYSMSWLNTLF